MAAAAGARAAAPASPQGVIAGKAFLDIGTGTAVADLTGNAKFPNSPDVVYYYPYFEWNADASGDISVAANNAYADNYGVQMIGYFYPPSTGDYTFYLAADDGANLYLSTDDTSANKKLIAQESGWSNPRNWETVGGGSTIEAKNSQTFTGTQWATKGPAGGAKITLTANRPYYIEALMKEGGGGDNLAVAVAAPDGSIDPTLPIPGNYLSSDRNTGPLTIVTQPSSQTVAEGQPVTFTVVVDGTPPYSFQWKKNGTDIAGAASASYAISRAASADNGARFSVAITGAQGNATSSEAVLTVAADVTPPTIEKVRSTDTFNIARITFTEAVNNAAVTPSNYTFTGGLTVSDASFAITVDDANNPEDPKNPTNPVNRLTVVLKTSTQTEGAVYDLTINPNVKDLVGNAISPNTATMYANVFKTGIVLHKRWYGLGHRNFQTLLADPGNYESPTAVFVKSLVEEDDADLPNQAYMTTLSGFFIPPTTGDYVFYISVDNYGWLYLSTDDAPMNQVLVAAEIGWNGTRVWTGPGATTTAADPANGVAAVYRRGVADPADPYAPWIGPFENRSDEFLTSERFLTQNLEANRPFNDIVTWPTVDAEGNAKITLTAGRRYSFTLYHSEPEGGQSCATFKLANEADPANGTASRMTGNLIGALVDPSSLPPVITNQPVGIDFTLGGTINLSVGVDSAAPPQYQWYRGLTPVAGATNRTLTISNATFAHAGPYYVAVKTVNGTVNSANVLVYTPAPPPPQRIFQQGSTGLVVMEAENYYNFVRAPDGHAWFPQADRSGYVGTGFVQALPDSGVNNGAYPALLTASPRLDYQVNFTKTGTHYVWLRGGARLADGGGDSVHAGIDGDNPASARRIDGTPSFNIATGWNWVGNIQGDTRASIQVASAGEHTINIWMREDGLVLDRILLTTDETFAPTGDGPAESPSTGGGVTPTISIARSATGGPAITFTGTLQRTTALGTPTTWTDVSGAVSPYTPPLTATQEFYRARQ